MFNEAHAQVSRNAVCEYEPLECFETSRVTSLDSYLSSRVASDYGLLLLTVVQIRK